MLCIQSCGKPAHTGAFAPNHVLMFVQNPAFGYCAPPCVDEEKGLSRVKVFRTPEGPSSQLRSFSTAGSAFWSGVPERVVPKRFRSGFWSGSGAGGVLERVPEQVPERVLEQVPERVSGAGSRAFPQRLPERFRSGFPARSDQNHCAKPCKMHGHQRLGHTVSYALCSLSTRFVMVIS